MVRGEAIPVDRFFEQIDRLDLAWWMSKGEMGSASRAVGLVQTEDEPIFFFGGFKATKGEIEPAGDREKRASLALPPAGSAISGLLTANASFTTPDVVQSPSCGKRL